MLQRLIFQNIIVFAVSFLFFSCGSFFWGKGNDGSSDQDRGWKVWVKTSPCVGGRTDWISVAKENPTHGGGGSFFQTADLILTPSACTTVSDNSCTFAQASEVANQIRTSSRFASYCCRDYSVWQNSQTQEFSVVKGYGSAGFGWQQVKSDLCCEEAEQLSGKTGLCGGTGEAGKTGYVGCFKDTSAFDLDGFLVRSAANTPESCIATCRAKGFAYAGVQYGESCLCGNSYGRYGEADNCNYKCTGDSSKTCGGYNANSIYGTGVAVTTGGVGGKKGKRNGGDGEIWEDGGRDDREITGNSPAPTPTTGAGGIWVLESVTVIPETPDKKMGWNFSGAQATSAHLDVYNGDKHVFQWTKPPQQFDMNGFTVSQNVQCQSQPNNRCASLMGVAGRGIESETRDGSATANGENGSLGSGQKSVTFKPIANSEEIEFRVELMWGAVRFIYKYKRA